MPIKKMHELNLNNKRVLIREDLNVPIQAGKITNGAARLHAVLPTIKQALSAGAAVILLSHLGRPKEGQFDASLSLAPVAEHLATLLEMPVRFEPEWLNGIAIQPGEVVLCENVRFNVGENNNDETLAKKIAALCDVFVMDAFGTGHRAHASTSGAAQFAPTACAGPLLTAELETLEKVLAAPAKPMIAIVAGSKVSTKLTLLKNLFDKVDELIVGGGIANTLIAASGYGVGKSLYEAELIPEAKNLIQQAKQKNVNIPIPKDVIVAKVLSPTATAEVKLLTEIQDDDLILDIGPETARDYAEKLKQAGTIVWNGPVGVFELEQFSEGTKTLAGAIAASEAFSIAGGGDTLAAIEKYEVTDKISYISTGGGAFLEFLEGKTFPVIEILRKQS